MNQWILERILGYPIFRQSHMDSIEFMVFKRLITGFSMLILDIGWELAGLLDWVPPLETEISPWKDGHLDQKWWWKSRGTLIWGWRTYKFPGFHFDFLGILLAQMDIQTSKVGQTSGLSVLPTTSVNSRPKGSCGGPSRRMAQVAAVFGWAALCGSKPRTNRGIFIYI